MRPLTIQVLENEYTRRKAANPRYSLRAFAAAMHLPPGRLSELLSGKRSATPKLCARIVERLGLSPEQAEALTGKPASPSTEARYATIAEDQFALISEWYHTAFLSLLETKDFRADPAWIARRLGLGVVEVRAMLRRLERLGLIERKGDKFQRLTGDLKTTTDIPSAALKRSHRQSILQAADTLDTVPTELRDITSMTMAIDPRKLPLAKTLIRDFRFRLAELLETGARSEVYNLNVQLVPVTKKEKS